MARLSKSKLHSFTIFEDTGTVPRDAAGPPPNVEIERSNVAICQKQDGVDIVEDEVEPDEHSTNPTDDIDADDERRESADTARTSTSSVAQSVIRTNIDAIPMHQSYTPPFIRPSFRRPHSVQRMQMTSPTPSRTASPRQSVLSKSARSRGGTPRHGRSIGANGSPRSKRWTAQTSSEEEEEAPQKQDPLVLLHVVLLSIEMPWSDEIMQSLLPQHTLDDLRLLRSRISTNVLQRGVLIPHPGEDYELLEERLLEALGLQEGRITACGHFRRPERSVSSPVASESETDGDSGHGSSLDSADGNICGTCQSPIKSISRPGNKNWEIKAFAANGLLRSAAWAAAWTEMERVDVEILPFITDEVRMRLDERQKHEELERRDREVAEEVKIAALVEERVALAREQMDADRPSRKREQDEGPIIPIGDELMPTAESGLPQVYRPSQVPVSILLRNYIYLLAQDRRNVVMFCVATLVALLLATKSSSAIRSPNSYSVGGHCGACPPAPELVFPMPSAAVQRDDVEEQGESTGILGGVLDLASGAAETPDMDL